ncbi:MAG: TlpA family protein disulfide reductase [Halobacteria archaeon]
MERGSKYGSGSSGGVGESPVRKVFGKTDSETSISGGLFEEGSGLQQVYGNEKTQDDSPDEFSLDEGVTVVEFFRSWSADCRRQNAVISRANRLLGNVDFITVSDEDVVKGELREWWSSHGNEWSIYLDDGGFAERFDVHVYPSIAVLSKGELFHSSDGFLDSSSLIRVVEQAKKVTESQ